jgi:Zn-dependent peptidase ImmA (M78 family)/DNA-binding XRE family transcriptional regulator
MAKRTEALINPDILVWARRTSHYDLETAAQKAKVGREELRQWESGDARPSIPQLRKLANVYKRPLALFYLAEPPLDFKPIEDYRRLDPDFELTVSPELALEIRKAHTRREIALDAAEELDEIPQPFQLVLENRRDAEAAGQELRRFLEVSIPEQQSWRSRGDAYSRWRRVFEARGILTFQMTRVAVQEARGFSFHDRLFPFVATNGADADAGRVFTLFHELAHLGLKESALCDLREDTSAEQNDEIFCNHVAGAALVPRDVLLSHSIVTGHRGSEWQDGELRKLANRFNVSREVVLRRLLIAGRTTISFYRTMRKQFAEEAAARPKSDGGPLRHDLIRAQVGDQFANLVRSAWHNDIYTLRDVSDYLGLKIRHIKPLETSIRLRRVS